MEIRYAVSSVMSKDIVSVNTTATLSLATKLMVENDIGSLVVTEGHEMIGILTERDVLKQFCFDPECASMKVGDVMSSPLITIDSDAAIGQAADLMAERKIRRLLVTDEGEIRGIITERDLMRATLDVFRKLSDAWV
jgi:CBS domain-containing protein